MNSRPSVIADEISDERSEEGSWEQVKGHLEVPDVTWSGQEAGKIYNSHVIARGMHCPLWGVMETVSIGGYGN